MTIAQSLLIATASVMMVVALVLAFIPLLPGPVLVWAVAIIFGVLDGFQYLSPAAAIITTILMLIGVTCDWWLAIFGIKTGGMSCMATIGSFAGGFLCTFLIPIPVVGTLIGCVLGALLFELARFREIRKALQAGQSAAKMFILSYVVELAASVAIAVTFFVSLLTAGSS
ncbi:MAG: DUF456 domain-containing protein [Anaerolineae bacterium]|nr:DUF456 domain-containing protein [Anaerolineae bacterium]